MCIPYLHLGIKCSIVGECIHLSLSFLQTIVQTKFLTHILDLQAFFCQTKPHTVALGVTVHYCTAIVYLTIIQHREIKEKGKREIWTSTAHE